MKLLLKFFCICIIWIYTMPVFAWSFVSDFVAPLVKWDKVYSSLSEIDINKPFTESLKDIFYPPIWDSDWWAIRDLIRNIWVGLLVIMLIWTGWMMVVWADDPEERVWAYKSLLYIIYWVVIFFWATWILGTVLNIWDFSGLIWSDNDSLINKAEEWFVLQLIWFLKAFAFFVAIAMVARYWSRLIFASWEDDKISAARTWLLNVMIALIFIKIIDFLYYIAQSWDFEWLAIDTIVNVAQFLWFLFGAAIFLSFLYVWFVFLTSWGSDDRISRAKVLIKNIVVVMLVVMLFLLVMFQIFSEVTL